MSDTGEYTDPNPREFKAHDLSYDQSLEVIGDSAVDVTTVVETETMTEAERAEIMLTSIREMRSDVRASLGWLASDAILTASEVLTNPDNTISKVAGLVLIAVSTLVAGNYSLSALKNANKIRDLNEMNSHDDRPGRHRAETE